jgi:hypothetical protein
MAAEGEESDWAEHESLKSALGEDVQDAEEGAFAFQAACMHD